jgi:ribose transport system substrate-binding protein
MVARGPNGLYRYLPVACFCLYAQVSIRNSFMASNKLICAQVLAVLSASSGCAHSPLPTVAVVPRTTALMLWEAEHAGAEASASRNGFRVYWNAPTREDDTEKQIALVERLVSERVQGLVLAPDQPLALMTPVRRALARNIPVVIIGSPLSIPAGGKLLYILNDEQQVGYIAAMRMGKILNGTGTIAVVGINPSVSGMTTRLRSFEENLSKHFPQIQIKEYRSDLFNSAQAQQAVEETLEAHPDLDAVLALSAMSTRGAYFALSKRHDLGKVKLIGCDQELLPPLRTGEIDSIIIENTYEMGYRAITSIAALRRGEIVTPLVQLSPVLVTQENIDQPEITRMLTMQWKQTP